MKEKYKQLYRMTSIIIAALIALLTFIIFIGSQGIRDTLILTILFTVVAYVISLLARKMSMRYLIIVKGLKRLWMKIIFFVGVPILSFIVAYASSWIVMSLYDLKCKIFGSSKELAPALGEALFAIFISLIVIGMIVMPYIETIIVLILTKVFKKNDPFDFI